LKVLITGGGTLERIDDVRSIANFSTGGTAALIADYFHKQGANVTLLHGKNAQKGSGNFKKEMFESFSDLDCLLKKNLGEKNFKAVIHLAAVSDYSVESIEIEGVRYRSEDLKKIDSGGSVSLHLKRNYKIIERLKDYSLNPKIQIVGFKLTSCFKDEERIKAVKKLLSIGHINYVIHNDLTEINEHEHFASGYNNNAEILFKTKTKDELAKFLFDLLLKYERGSHDFVS